MYCATFYLYEYHTMLEALFCDFIDYILNKRRNIYIKDW